MSESVDIILNYGKHLLIDLIAYL